MLKADSAMRCMGVRACAPVLLLAIAGGLTAEERATAGAPAPVYRTLKEAAQAGVNPMASPTGGRPVSGSAQTAVPRRFWAALVGGGALAIILGATTVLILAHHSRARSKAMADEDLARASGTHDL